MFASLPFEFVAIATTVGEFIGLTPHLEGKAVDAEKIKSHLEHCRDELIGETGDDAESESLAIFIQSTYPRR